MNMYNFLFCILVHNYYIITQEPFISWFNIEELSLKYFSVAISSRFIIPLLSLPTFMRQYSWL